MGLRPKAVLVVAVIVTTQIMSSHCKPRRHSKCSHGGISEDIEYPGTRRTRSQALYSNFPNVEYPSDFIPEECYRFKNEYPLQFTSKNGICNCSSAAQKCKMGTKFKRKLDMATSVKSDPKTTASCKQYDPDCKPYCFRRSSFFPEVEYPLSTRDMWISNYWSKLQDVKINENVDACLNKITPGSNYDSDYENSALSSLIKALNAKKVLNSPTSNANLQPPFLNQTANRSEIADLHMISQININDDPHLPISQNLSLPNNIIPSKSTETSNLLNSSSIINENNFTHNETNSTIANMTNNDRNPEIYKPKESVQGDIISKTGSLSDIVSTTANEGMENSPNDNDVPSTTKLTVSHSQLKLLTAKEANVTCSDISSKRLTNIVPENTTLSDTTLSLNSFSPIGKTLTEAIATTPASYSTNIFTPLEYDFDLTDMKTAAPFDYITSPMSILGTSIDDKVLSQSRQNLSSHVASPNTSTTPIPILTTNLPSCLSSSPNLSNNYYDYLIVDYVCPQNLSDKNIGKHANDCQLPKYTDELIIYVDTENSALCLGNFSDKTLTTEDYILYNDDWNCSLSDATLVGQVMSTVTNIPFFDEAKKRQPEETNITTVGSLPGSIVNSTKTDLIYPDYSCIFDYATGNTTQDVALNEIFFIVEADTDEANNTMDQVLYFDHTNSSMQYDYIEGTMTSFTEIPYDLVLDPEYINGHAYINDTLVTYETICDCPDSSCVIFVDKDSESGTKAQNADI